MHGLELSICILFSRWDNKKKIPLCYNLHALRSLPIENREKQVVDRCLFENNMHPPPPPNPLHSHCIDDIDHVLRSKRMFLFVSPICEMTQIYNQTLNLKLKKKVDWNMNIGQFENRD